MSIFLANFFHRHSWFFRLQFFAVAIELLPSFHVEEATDLYPFYVNPFFNFKFFANFEFYAFVFKEVLRMSNR
jgi:hypothetical protein